MSLYLHKLYQLQNIMLLFTQIPLEELSEMLHSQSGRERATVIEMRKIE